MRLIIAGSRTITDYDILLDAIQMVDTGPFGIERIISGGAKGADTLGERYAKENGIVLHIYLADWHRYGLSAGYRRNKIMAERADTLLVLWDGISKGSMDMIQQAHKNNLKVYIKDMSE
jgi:predicted Rossmann fold nucleotide-binding protein DprA/Smf involved in DNA uptake